MNGIWCARVQWVVAEAGAANCTLHWPQTFHFQFLSIDYYYTLAFRSWWRCLVEEVSAVLKTIVFNGKTSGISLSPAFEVIAKFHSEAPYMTTWAFFRDTFIYRKLWPTTALKKKIHWNKIIFHAVCFFCVSNFSLTSVWVHFNKIFEFDSKTPNSQHRKKSKIEMKENLQPINYAKQARIAHWNVPYAVDVFEP